MQPGIVPPNPLKKNLKIEPSFIEVATKKKCWNVTKIEKKELHSININIYLHERLNGSKGLVWNKNLSLYSITGIKKKQAQKCNRC